MFAELNENTVLGRLIIFLSFPHSKALSVLCLSAWHVFLLPPSGSQWVSTAPKEI